MFLLILKTLQSAKDTFKSNKRYAFHVTKWKTENTNTPTS